MESSCLIYKLVKQYHKRYNYNFRKVHVHYGLENINDMGNHITNYELIKTESNSEYYYDDYYNEHNHIIFICGKIKEFTIMLNYVNNDDLYILTLEYPNKKTKNHKNIMAYKYNYHKLLFDIIKEFAIQINFKKLLINDTVPNKFDDDDDIYYITSKINILIYGQPWLYLHGFRYICEKENTNVIRNKLYLSEIYKCHLPFHQVVLMIMMRNKDYVTWKKLQTLYYIYEKSDTFSDFIERCCCFDRKLIVSIIQDIFEYFHLSEFNIYISITTFKMIMEL